MSDPRPRPIWLSPEAFRFDYFISNIQRDTSFPSGHTCFIATVAAVAWYDDEMTVFYVFSVLSICTAFSRVYCGVHYPSDVLMGEILGLAATIPIMKYDLLYGYLLTSDYRQNLVFTAILTVSMVGIFVLLELASPRSSKSNDPWTRFRWKRNIDKRVGSRSENTKRSNSTMQQRGRDEKISDLTAWKEADQEEATTSLSSQSPDDLGCRDYVGISPIFGVIVTIFWTPNYTGHLLARNGLRLLEETPGFRVMGMLILLGYILLVLMPAVELVVANRILRAVFLTAHYGLILIFINILLPIAQTLIMS